MELWVRPIEEAFLYHWALKCLQGARLVGRAFRILTQRTPRKTTEGTETPELPPKRITPAAPIFSAILKVWFMPAVFPPA